MGAGLGLPLCSSPAHLQPLGSPREKANSRKVPKCSMPAQGCHHTTSLAGSHLPAAPQRPHTLKAAVPRKAALCQARSSGSWGGWWVRIWEVTQPHLGMGVTEKPPLPKRQDTKGWRSGSSGWAGCQRTEKNRLDEAVGTRRRRRVPRDRGGGHCRVSQAPSPLALHPRGPRSSAPQRDQTPRASWQWACP